MPDRRTPSRRPGRSGRPTAPARSRPAQRGTARTRPVEVVEAVPRARYTNRMVVLVLVFAVLVISYASSMRAYLQQRSHLDGLQAQIASSQRQIDSLKTEKGRWQDDAYVEQQARERFGWVLPGETAYQVLGPDGKPLVGTDELSKPVGGHPKQPEAWWGKAYTTLQEADHPRKAAPPPPPPIKKIVPSSGKK